MSRGYGYIKQFENEILEMKSRGLTQREIADNLGFSKYQIKEFLHSHNRNQRKLATGIVIKPKGRPRKDGSILPPSVQQLSKLTQLQYELARKDRHIKRLEMENELMRDFLLLAERK